MHGRSGLATVAAAGPAAAAGASAGAYGGAAVAAAAATARTAAGRRAAVIAAAASLPRSSSSWQPPPSLTPAPLALGLNARRLGLGLGIYPLQQQQQQQHVRGIAVRSRAAKRRSAAGGGSSGNGGDDGGGLAVVERVEEKELHAEASESYLSYAMSVIVGRALPDVRDGLKPVHRRILYAMHDLGITPGKPYKKCARVVGEVLGKYHPHGDAAVYDALVRLAQDFSMRLPLISGHGNFGSLDDDPPAAMRYTECRLAAVAPTMLLEDLAADTVDWAPTFDASQEEPTVLPAKVPLLLVNGTQGIAVGIATKIPPHNLSEVVDGLVALVEDPSITVEALMKHIPGPDFPTGGELLVGPGIKEAYETGSGSIVLRAHVTIEGEGSGSSSARRRKKGAVVGKAAAFEEEGEERGGGGGSGGRQLIVVTEVPYQVNKAELASKIAELVESKTIEGVADVRDESDRTGVRLVVEVKRGFEAKVVLNQLFRHTRLQSRFSCNMVALVGGVPQTLDLKAFLQHFLDFRVGVVERRARHALAKAKARLHLVEGYLKALAALDAVVQAIRDAPDAAAARAVLSGPRFKLSEEQAEGVLGLTLRRLTGLEVGKLKEEEGQLKATIAGLESLLGDRSKVLGEVVREARELAAKHGAPRSTRLVTVEGSGEGGEGGAADGQLREEDLVPNVPCLVTLSSRGYVKRLSPDAFEAQRRGGKGKSGGRLRDNDSLEAAVSCSTHDALLLLASSGKAYSVRAWGVPESSRAAAGTAVAQVLGLSAAERFTAMLPVAPAMDGSSHLVMATSKGLVKRTQLSFFSSLQRVKRSSGLVAIKLEAGDELTAAGLAEDGGMVLLTSSGGRVANFEVSGEIFRAKGRASQAMKGMKLPAVETVVSMAILSPQQAAAVRAQHEALGAEEEGADEDTAAASDIAVGADEAGGDGDEAGGPEEAGPWMIIVTAKGIGKRVSLARLPLRRRRGTAGNIAIKLDAGDSVAIARLVESAEDEVLLASRGGNMARLRVKDVRCPKGRASRGSRLISLKPGDEVQTCMVVPPSVE